MNSYYFGEVSRVGSDSALRATIENFGPVASIIAILIPLLILVVMLIIWIKAAKNMARIAADKGYPERKWFHYCFWLGLVGYLMVCAMPDKNRRS